MGRGAREGHGLPAQRAALASIKHARGRWRAQQCVDGVRAGWPEPGRAHLPPLTHPHRRPPRLPSSLSPRPPLQEVLTSALGGSDDFTLSMDSEWLAACAPRLCQCLPLALG